MHGVTAYVNKMVKQNSSFLTCFFFKCRFKSWSNILLSSTFVHGHSSAENTTDLHNFLSVLTSKIFFY